MALAAALAADGVRPVSFLPTVKCSNCGREIEISEMGEHICGGEQPQATNGHMSTMSNPFTLRRFNASGQQLPSHPPVPQVSDSFRSPPKTSQMPGVRPPRSTLPKINPDAANGPFLAPGQAGLDSPISPAASYRSGSSNGKPPFHRSMTSPAPRLYDPRPPSPELSANLDCAFPPFPTSSSPITRPSTSHGRRTPTGNERAPSRATSRLDHVVTAAEPEHFNVDPSLAKSSGNGSVLQKLNTIKSGPFSATRRQGSGDSRDGTAFPDRRRPSEPTVEALPTRPSTASSNYSLPRRPSIPTSSIPQPSQKKSPPPRPARPVEEVLSPSFLDQFSAEPSSSIALPLQHNDQERKYDRSNTFPFQNLGSESEHAHSLSRMRSEPAMSGRRPSLAHGPALDPSATPQTQVITPRSDSLTGNRVDYRIQDAPPVPRAVQQYRQDSVHTPSESGSSITSSNNSRSTTNSSGVSPVGSVASSVDAFSPLTLGSHRYGDDEQMRVAGLNVRSPEKPGMRAEQPTQRSPPRNVSRPARETPKNLEDVSLTPLESPMDPMLLTMQQKVPQPPANQSRPAPLRTQTAPGPVPRARAPQGPGLPIAKRSVTEGSPSGSASEPEVRPRTPSNTSPQSTVPSTRNASPNSLRPPAIPQEPQKRHHGRRPTIGKPNCRGCGQMIEGKSVKAADGRLTGRWHKACFVCRSCHEPFTTADFYVINNEPYCEQHYHENNGSLCNGCHRGIEGQYLETSSSTRFGSIEKKFHPRCFCCCECRAVLSNDYFEITGKVYCERHALAAMRAQARMAGGLNAPNQRGLHAERRTTRLINPMMA